MHDQELTTQEHEEALAIATSIFVAGFFLGIGTGILLAPHGIRQVGTRFRDMAGRLMDDAKQAIEGSRVPRAGE